MSPGLFLIELLILLFINCFTPETTLSGGSGWD